MQVRKNFLLSLGALSFLTLLLSGCLKETKVSSQPPKTFLSLLHLAPRAPSVTVFFNTEQASGAVSPGTVFQNYSAVDPGIFSISFKKSGTDSLVTSLGTDIYDTLKHYTLLLYNPDTAHVNVLRIQDDFSVLSNTTRAYYRFFHMAPDVGPVDVYLDNSSLETGREYADNTNSYVFNQFESVAPNTYNIVVKKAGTDTVVAQTYSVYMGAGSAYTLFLKGIAGRTDNTALKVDYLMATD